MTARFAVIILNWNGAKDTIECLRSVLYTDPLALPIVIDNGSTDNSVDEILAYFAANDLNVVSGTAEGLIYQSTQIKQARAVFVCALENLGFAAGSNLGLQLVFAWGIEYIVFLNNDTIIETGALSGLVERLRQDSDYFAILPQLIIYGAGRIWNCGGRITSFGFRRYFYSGVLSCDVNLPPEISCSFFTGCCFAVRTAEFVARSGFNERFFFGEEDFELSLWMKHRGLKALCLTSCIVHHKVSASISRASSESQASKIYVHYLNRFIHMRHRFGYIRWLFWLFAYLPYIAILLAVRGLIPVKEIPFFMGTLIKRATNSDKVSRSDFESIMKVKPW